MPELPPPLDGQKCLEQVGLLLGLSRVEEPPESDVAFRQRLLDRLRAVRGGSETGATGSSSAVSDRRTDGAGK